MLLRHIPQNKFFVSKLLLFLREIKFNKQKFSNSNFILNIQY